MILSDFTYGGTTFYRFIRGSGVQAEVVPGDQISIRSTRDPLPAQPGIQRYIDEYGSRLVEIRGYVKGRTEQELYGNIEALRRSFDIKALEASFPDTHGFAPLDWDDPAGGSARYFLKPISRTLNVVDDRNGLARRFSVLLEAKDPTKYTSNVVTTTLQISDVSTGGSLFPFEFPVPFSGLVGVSTTTLNIPGSTDVYPDKITFTGTDQGIWVGPSLTNQTTGGKIVFTSSATLADSTQYLEIIPRDGVVRKFNGSAFENMSQFLTSDSSFWKLIPGNNILSLTGGTAPIGASATIIHTNPF